MRHIDLDSNEVYYFFESKKLLNLFKNNKMTLEFLKNNIVGLKKLLNYYMGMSNYNSILIERFDKIKDEDFVVKSDRFFNKLRDRLKTENNLEKVNEILQEKPSLLNFEKGFSFLGAEFAFEYKKSHLII